MNARNQLNALQTTWWPIVHDKSCAFVLCISQLNWHGGRIYESLVDFFLRHLWIAFAFFAIRPYHIFCSSHDLCPFFFIRKGNDLLFAVVVVVGFFSLSTNRLNTVSCCCFFFVLFRFLDYSLFFSVGFRPYSFQNSIVCSTQQSQR